MNKLKSVIFFLLCFSIILAGKNPVILSGCIQDSITFNKITGVNIIIDNTNIGTVSGKNGNFNLIIDKSDINSDIIFSHIAYEEKKVSINNLIAESNVFLIPKNIQLQKIQVEGKRKALNYEENITNMATIITELNFESKGYTDVADVLHHDQGIFIEENLNGKKTISVRGSNKEEVLILYDGVKLNNNFNNLFDLSLIDPSSLKQIDVIKGANRASFGALNSAAVINFIPKSEQDYLLKFEQRFGTYNSGDWRINIYKNIKNFKVFSSFKKGSSSQRYIANLSQDDHIIHNSQAGNMNITYGFGNTTQPEQKHVINTKYLITKRNYTNNLFYEELINSQRISTFSYSCNLEKFGKAKINFANNFSSENRDWTSVYGAHSSLIDDNMYRISTTYSLNRHSFSLVSNIIRENSELDYQTHFQNSVINNINKPDKPFTRKRTGYTTTFQFQNKDQNNRFNLKEISFHLGFEQIKDHISPYLAINPGDSYNRKWFENSNTLNILFDGQYENNSISTYINLGVTNTIPSLYQQLNYQRYHIFGDNKNELMAEYKKTVEVGFTYSGYKIFGNNKTSISTAIFSNDYSNKFRSIRISQSPLLYFDNYKETDIEGIESSISTNFLNNLLGLNLSLIKYFAPDKGAFPFKSDKKITSTLFFKYKIINIDLYWFSESEKAGLIIENSEIKEISFDKYSNFDILCKINFNILNTKLICSLSGRNLLTNNDTFEGIAIHDTRYYCTFGVEF